LAENENLDHNGSHQLRNAAKSRSPPGAHPYLTHIAKFAFH